ncbi:hypothetical protein NL676_002023 [Syzygium grande]|nr:hypothetical protein NL676_002023 [Syzygium grande]
MRLHGPSPPRASSIASKQVRFVSFTPAPCLGLSPGLHLALASDIDANAAAQCPSRCPWRQHPFPPPQLASVGIASHPSRSQ